MSAKKGVQNWYYTRNLPARAVGVAKVVTPPATPNQLISVNNFPYNAGSLHIWKQATGIAGTPDWTISSLNKSIQINGSTIYYVDNQFFEITNIASTAGNPLYYQHLLPIGVTQVSILDVNGALVSAETFVNNSYLYHSLDGKPYFVRYVTIAGYLETHLLRYDKVIRKVAPAPLPNGYVFNGAVLELAATTAYWIRFTQANGYMLMPTYNYLSNTPWYPRVRFSLNPTPVDWATQHFSTAQGYLLAGYVPGTVLSKNLVEFERKNIYYDINHLPDILVFNADNSIKYALDGSAPNSPKRKGTVYNWKRGAIQSIDPGNARVVLGVDLDPTDIVFGFYSYYEPDVVYTALDLNPFTNPVIKNSIIQFYVKFDEGNVAQNLFHQVLDNKGQPIPGLTNDPSPTTGTNHIFAQLAVGASISTTQFTVTDIRVRGGGLIPSKQRIPQSVHMWDIGYWDGKPYPIASSLVAYLPLSILDTLSRSDVEGKLASILPMGSLAVIRYVDGQGQEYV